jgi:hypothetical protein
MYCDFLFPPSFDCALGMLQKQLQNAHMVLCAVICKHNKTLFVQTRSLLVGNSTSTMSIQVMLPGTIYPLYNLYSLTLVLRIITNYNFHLSVLEMVGH